ncbi:hypothetical protein JYT61_01195, partial [bacterium AH-315-E10]|nr:hypothetical protein [bacterium AH-315-E10]
KSLASKEEVYRFEGKAVELCSDGEFSEEDKKCLESFAKENNITVEEHFKILDHILVKYKLK